MCFTVSTVNLKPEKLATLFDIDGSQGLPEIKIQTAISGFSHPNLLVLINQNTISFSKMFWGLVPSWTKNRDEAKKFRVNNLNAKSETIFEKPSFSDSILSRRCIIPISGFYEWYTLNKEKYPHFIHLTESEIMCIAGIYDTWFDLESGRKLYTFSMVTTEANVLMARIHNTKRRMPLILDFQSSKKWLESGVNQIFIEELMQPYESDRMRAYSVNKNFFKAENSHDHATLPKEVYYPELVFRDL